MKKKHVVLLALFLCSACIGCGSEPDSSSEPGNVNSIDNLKARAATVTEYTCDFTRQFGSEEVRGRLCYKDESIRFEMFGSSPDDTTVTIVNQEEDKTYTYNTRMKKGQMDEPAAFLLDVPLPGEIMSVLNTENAAFIGQPERDGHKCTAFQATDVQFFGFKFTGEIIIANESGLPVYVSGRRDSIPITYEYKNYSTGEVYMSEFSLPGSIIFN